MNTYSNISNELKSYFSSNPIFRILLPLHMIFLFGGVGLLVINIFASIGNFLSAIAYYSFLLGLLLAYANYKQRDLYIGMFIYAALQLYNFLKYAIFASYRFVDFRSLIAFIIFAGLGYLLFKKDSTTSTGTTISG